MHFQHELDIAISDDEDSDWIGECECGKAWRSNSRSEVCDEWLAHIRYLLWVQGFDNSPRIPRRESRTP